MNKIPVLGAFLLSALFVGSAGAASLESFLKTAPEQAAHQAAEKGDFRYMSAPSCFDGLPGYAGSSPPEPWPPKKAFKGCEQLVGEAVLSQMKQLSAYAKSYNQTISVLRKKNEFEN